MAQLEAEHNDEVLRLQSVNRNVEIRYMDRIRVVEKAGEERIKYVTKYITKEDDDRCDISPSFVELHDAAAQDRMPEPGAPGEFDAGTTQPQLSDVGRTVVTNYSTCHAIREQLKALQEWAREIGNVPNT